MAIIKKAVERRKQELEDFLNFKNLSTSNLEWCKWAGWMDTDGSIQINKSKKNKSWTGVKVVRLNLKDRQPVELLSNFFETALCYFEYRTVTPEPYRKEYIAKQHVTTLYNDKAVCMTKNIYPYLLKDAKKQYAINLLGYEPESKPLDEWTKEEFVSYFATVAEGDGYIQVRYNKKNNGKAIISIESSDAEYLSKLKYLLDRLFNICGSLSEVRIYKTKDGIKCKYRLTVYHNREFYSLLTAPNIMTLDRKKNKLLEVLN